MRRRNVHPKSSEVHIPYGTYRWEDGQRVNKRLEHIDRWETHAAVEIEITLEDINICLRPQPQLLSAAKVGVGACLWDSSIVLTAYLGTLKQVQAYVHACAPLII
jgi:hypothetical protein